MLRAKMQCTAVSDYFNGRAEGDPLRAKVGEELRLHAVVADSPENKVWSSFTPSGNLYMHITNPDAWGACKVGDYYYVDIGAIESAVAATEPAPA